MSSLLIDSLAHSLRLTVEEDSGHVRGEGDVARSRDSVC